MPDEENDDLLEDLRKQLAKEEAILHDLEAPVRRQLKRVQQIRAMISAGQAGSFSSRDTSDSEIVEHVRAHAREKNPLNSTEIARGMGIDPRGLSRRLPRMAADGLLRGTPTQGYWAP